MRELYEFADLHRKQECVRGQNSGWYQRLDVFGSVIFKLGRILAQPSHHKCLHVAGNSDLLLVTSGDANIQSKYSDYSVRRNK
jgi:hypothetical protein